MKLASYVVFAALLGLVTVLALPHSILATESGEGEGVALDPSTKIPDFVPTNEWREVLPGQAIPPGLEVSMSFKTHKKMARLLQPEEEGEGEGEVNVAVAHKVHEAMPLMAIESDDVDDEEDQDTPTDPSASHLLGGSKGTPKKDPASPPPMTEEERDQMLKYMGAKLQKMLDAEDIVVIREKLSFIGQQSSPLDEVTSQMDDLSEYLHQYDNANDFVSIGGPSIILARLTHPLDVSFINDADDSLPPSELQAWLHDISKSTEYGSNETQIISALRVQAESALLLGTIGSNHPQTQEALVKLNVVPLLVKLVERTLSDLETGNFSGPAALHRVVFVHRLLFAMGAICRQNGDGTEMLISKDWDIRDLMIRLLSFPLDVSDSSLISSKYFGTHGVRLKTIRLIRDVIGDQMLNNIPSTTADIFMENVSGEKSVLQTLLSLSTSTKPQLNLLECETLTETIRLIATQPQLVSVLRSNGAEEAIVSIIDLVETIKKELYGEEILTAARALREQLREPSTGKVEL